MSLNVAHSALYDILPSSPAWPLTDSKGQVQGFASYHHGELEELRPVVGNFQHSLFVFKAWKQGLDTRGSQSFEPSVRSKRLNMS